MRCVAPERNERILQILRLPHTRKQLAERLGLSPAALERHLADLRHRGLVECERDAGEVRYRRSSAAEG